MSETMTGLSLGFGFVSNIESVLYFLVKKSIRRTVLKPYPGLKSEALAKPLFRKRRLNLSKT